MSTPQRLVSLPFVNTPVHFSAARPLRWDTIPAPRLRRTPSPVARAESLFFLMLLFGSLSLIATLFTLVRL